MKASDEIKTGLECCKLHDGDMYTDCSHCPYYLTCTQCDFALHTDALAYIQQLEATNAELLTKVEQLEKKCRQLERERDAMVADIPRACGYCKWFEINRGGNMTECHNPNGCRNISGINTGWEWRGVKEE